MKKIRFAKRTGIAFILIMILCTQSVFGVLAQAKVLYGNDKEGVINNGEKFILSVNLPIEHMEYEYSFKEQYEDRELVVQEFSEQNKYETILEGIGVHKFLVEVRDKTTQDIVEIGENTYEVLVQEVETESEKRGELKNEEVIDPSKSESVSEEMVEGSKEINVENSMPLIGNTPKNNSKLMGKTKVSEAKVTNLGLQVTSNKSVSEKAGTEITLKAQATGGDGSYEYRYTETYNGKVTTVRGYSTEPSYTFKAKGVGVHKYTVAVRDASGGGTSVNYTQTVLAGEAISLQVTSNKGASEKAGTEITLKAQATGGDGSYEYRYTETYNGKVTTVRGYSTEPSYTFKAEGVGIHKYTIAVKDSSGGSNSVVYTQTVTIESGKELTGTLKANINGTVTSGEEIELVAKGQGGYGNYEYRFTETYNGVSKTVQAYSEKNTYKFMVTGMGTHKFTVAIKDKQNQVTSSACSIFVQNYLPSENIGIDVSTYQGKVDWLRVKQAGIQFAMLRVVSGKMNNMIPDGQFYNNIRGAKLNGIKVGVYRYGYATTVEEARQEANKVIQTIKASGYKLDCPVAYDLEGIEQGALSKSELTAIINEFKKVIESNGYQFMIYANLYWLQSKIEMHKFSQDDVWIARYRDNTPNLGHGYNGPGNVTMWQYTSEGNVPGISGAVDMNKGYYVY